MGKGRIRVEEWIKNETDDEIYEATLMEANQSEKEK
ncbi:YhdX family protein [Metabacillus arenae]|uniref:YhdX family protein n=1 Tax=Metabacillus arenae TaxID=2771434 RepID=A0A926NQK8_9BACI|nr:YhdX family protein [Metabacillus arenae]MBD1382212.1 YhdX family protein [Metabacillus arenae]